MWIPSGLVTELRF
ncbi:unnamed protein product [Calypogeia fissa]